MYMWHREHREQRVKWFAISISIPLNVVRLERGYAWCLQSSSKSSASKLELFRKWRKHVHSLPCVSIQKCLVFAYMNMCVSQYIYIACVCVKKINQRLFPNEKRLQQSSYDANGILEEWHGIYKIKKKQRYEYVTSLFLMEVVVFFVLLWYWCGVFHLKHRSSGPKNVHVSDHFRFAIPTMPAEIYEK